MAYTYGSITNCKVRNGTTRSEYELRLGYEVQSQSIENNTSTVKLRLECRSTSSSYVTKGSNGLTSVIDGTTVKSNVAIDMSSTNTWQNFGERTITITHNADGTYSASKSGSFTCTAGSSSYSLSSGSASVTVKPATIPRASSMTWNGSTMGNSINFTISSASSSFTHTIKWWFGNESGILASNVGTSASWIPPVALTSQVINNTSGVGTFTLNTYSNGSLIGTKSYSFTLYVPSASLPSLVTYPNTTQNVTIGTSIAIHTNRKADTYTHTVRYAWGNKSGTIATGATNNCTWNIPIDFCNDIPNSLSGIGTVYVDTYNGTALVGTKSIGFTGLVPDSVVPSISSISLSEAGSLVPSSWGIYVQGKSQLKVTINASGSYGSTISTYKTTGIDSNTYWASSFVSTLLQGTGTNTITVKIVDSRGREATKTVSYSCVSYNNPSITNAIIARCNVDGTDNEEGEYVKYSFKADVASVSNKNSYSYKLGYKKSEDYSYEYITISNSSYTLNKENIIINGITFDVDNSYIFEFVVTDYFTNTAITRQLGTGFTLLDFNASGKGMAIGKVSQKEDALEINMDIYNKDGAVLEAVKVDKEAPTNKEVLWVKKGKNLFNGNYLTNYNYNSTTGALEKASSPMFCTSDKISIPVNAHKLVVSKYGSRIYVRYFFYNSNGSFLSTTASQVGVEVPTNAKYVTFHCTSDTVSGDFSTIQLETTDSSGKATDYEEYIERTINAINNTEEYEEILNVDKISNLKKYSLTEKLIGTWIDEKPLYRKILKTTKLSNSYADLNVQSIVDIRVMVSVDNLYLFNVSRNGSSTDIFGWYVNTQKKTIEIDVGSAWTFNEATIILEYTKTTD